MADVVITTEDLRLMIELVNDKIKMTKKDAFVGIYKGNQVIYDDETLEVIKPLEALQNKLYDIAEM